MGSLSFCGLGVGGQYFSGELKLVGFGCRAEVAECPPIEGRGNHEEQRCLC